jgi:SSS family solute:Na+ symporter
MNTFSALDTVVFLVFLVYFVVCAYGTWVYRRKRGSSGKASHDYFLAEGSLTW